MTRIYTNIVGQHVPRKSGFLAGSKKQSDILVKIWPFIVWCVCLPILERVMFLDDDDDDDDDDNNNLQLLDEASLSYEELWSWRRVLSAEAD